MCRYSQTRLTAPITRMIGHFAAMTKRIAFDDVLDAARDIVDGKVRGRLVVEIG